ncbi:MAG: NifU family protein [Candidatus Omnitrophota bacterium]|nr:MAG: NifU family protein [Candidatus Omnitrophota bacterium]
MRDAIEKILAEEVRPALSMHGGGVELVDVTKDGTVKVKLTGGCSGCPSAQMTLVGVVERAIKSKVPQVKKVEAV